LGKSTGNAEVKPRKKVKAMKKIKINIKKFMVVAMHLIFWLISVNLWNIIFNPGVESVFVIKGNQVSWSDLILINSLFFLYCLLPFSWFIKALRKWIKIALTIIFLIPVSFLLFQLYTHTRGGEDTAVIDIMTNFFISGFLYTVVFHLSIAAAVYFNLKVLIGRFLSRSKFGKYLGLAVLLIGVTSVVNFSFYNYCIDKIFPSLFFISYYKVWELLIIVTAYLVFTTIIFLVLQYAEMLIANRDKAQNELKALKAQINPHFLFNNLNTIYSLASNKDERTKDVILQLSDFLRYVLYDTTSESIPLEKEVEIIRTYVDLQKERVNPLITQVTLTLEGDFTNANIIPLLLLPLAENCFKHGIGKEPGKILIYIGFNGKQLMFTTENTIALREKTNEEENGGIGIKNVEKRLNLLYPNRHSINFKEMDGMYKVELKVDL
jgi:sensor histidine kinase YesM